MKKHLLFPILFCLLSVPAVFAQISNTETTITMLSGDSIPSRVCSWNNVPSSSAGNVYKIFVEFENLDLFAVLDTMPKTGYYDCTVTNTPNTNGPNIFINVPAANFPTVNNTILAWDFVQTKGRVVLWNTTTNTTYTQVWEYDQYTCPALPIYIILHIYELQRPSEI